MSSGYEEQQIRLATRVEILERDEHVCRLCGTFSEILHVHHIIYRSGGGKDVSENLVSLDWRCHDRVHGNKRLYLPVLRQVAITPGVNGLQLLRWYREKAS